MTLIAILLLSFVQGLTEFLPISSTGHLILFENFFNIPSSLEIDAFLHLGSFFAILIYFWKDLIKIWSWKWLIFISALPGGIAGLLLHHIVESYFRTPLVVTLALLVMTLPMILGERLGLKRLKIGELNLGKALFIGFAQALALIPGTSRSGITISAGLLVGLKREEAARYSFLAGAPLILGAGLYEGVKLVKGGAIPTDLAFAGFIGSFISSLIAIAFLIPFLKKYSLYAFILYRILLACFLLTLIFLKII
jgi:undecaprenyl-diphosphatase